MTTTDYIIQGVRRWLSVAASVPDVAHDVIPAHDTGAVPAEPYIVVEVLTYDIPVGTDEALQVFEAGTQRHVSRGARRATVTLHAWGDTAAGWIERAHMRLSSPSVRRQLSDDDLAIRAIGGLQSLSEGDTVRYVQDYEVQYLVRTTEDDPITVAQAAEIQTEYVRYDDDPDPLTDTLTEEL